MERSAVWPPATTIMSSASDLDAEEGEPVDPGGAMIGAAMRRVVERELVEVGLGDHLRQAPTERLLPPPGGADG